MKKALFYSVLMAISSLACAQNEITKKLHSFDKISVSPKINLVLVQGDDESIRVTYANVSEKKIRIEVAGQKLMVYLEDARLIDKRRKVYADDGHYEKVSEYEDASVTAYVTYRNLKQVEMRGEEELTCESHLKADKFKLKLYGKTEVNLASVNANKFKASLYGENKIKIKGGETTRQVYRLYGENKIDSRGVESITASANIYGEGQLRIKVTDEIRVNAFGEPSVDVTGGGNVNKGLVFGKVDIDRSK